MYKTWVVSVLRITLLFNYFGTWFGVVFMVGYVHTYTHSLLLNNMSLD